MSGYAGRWIIKQVVASVGAALLIGVSAAVPVVVFGTGGLAAAATVAAGPPRNAGGALPCNPHENNWG